MGEKLKNNLNHERTVACSHELVPVPVSEEFNLERAVCNHGFFMMAPNRWIPSQKSLIRPLRLNNSISDLQHVTVSITQPLPTRKFINVRVLHNLKHQLSTDDRQIIQDQVSRMLRISKRDDMMVKEFNSVCEEAKKLAFARIFRSPTLFEDIVKSLLLCCSTWSRSLEMAQALCDLPKISSEKKGSNKRKRSSCCAIRSNVDTKECCWRFKFQPRGNFPSPKEIARLNEDTLNQSCKLGYRASTIIQVARNIENGNLNLGDFENMGLSHDMLHQRLIKIKGFGPFVVANIMMCLGFYQDIPVDTETVKHLEQVHGKTGVTKNSKRAQREAISQIYDKYAPFQCLAYWMEHVEYYEKRLGKLSELPHSEYHNATATNLKVCSSEN